MLVAALVIAGCASDGDGFTEDTTATTTTTTISPSAAGDGRLIIGVLLPLGNTLVGEPMLAAIETAIERINAAGGVLDRTVGLVVADEGTSTATASSSIQELISQNVDAIIGPASSLIALSTLSTIVSAGKLVCSPTATSIALDDFPDDGLFFRTAPSDSLQARAIAETVTQTGAERVAIAYVDDPYGRPFSDAVEAALADEGLTAVERVAFSSTADDLSEQAAAITNSDARVAVVLANSEDATQLIEALDDEDTTGLATIVVNDALRNPAAPQRLRNIDPELRRRIVGLAAQADSGDAAAPFDPPGLFAVNAYDCANLIALAAVRAGSDAPADIATHIAEVSVSGSVCATYADCLATIDSGLQIDYNGPSGVTELSTRTGDPSRATFDRFAFNAAGRDELQRRIVVVG